MKLEHALEVRPKTPEKHKTIFFLEARYHWTFLTDKTEFQKAVTLNRIPHWSEY